MGSMCSKDPYNIHDYDYGGGNDKLEARKSWVRVEIPKSRKVMLEPNPNPEEKICRVIVGVAKAEQVAAGWPSWLASVAGDAIHGWTPRTPQSYQKLNKVPIFIHSFIHFLLLIN